MEEALKKLIEILSNSLESGLEKAPAMAEMLVGELQLYAVSPIGSILAGAL